jgi:phosphate-selective porin OprO/OprP
VIKRTIDHKSLKITNFINFSLAVGLGIVSSLSAYAAEPNYKGFMYGSKTDPYWAALNGALKLDERLFLGNKRGDLHSGASIREFSLNFSGGMGRDISIALGTSFDAKKSKVDVEDAYVTYSGYKGFGENFDISIGKVNSSFCLENHSSGKWIPFLERSSVTTAFRPDAGLGVSVNHWRDDHSINATITQPAPNDKTTDEKGNDVKHSDRLQFNARGTKAYFFEKNKLIQGGIFGHFKDDGHNGLEFSTPPEAKARHSTNMLLKTTTNSGQKIKANSHYTIGAEFLGQDGPLSGEVEYQYTKVNRDRAQLGGNLNFKGYRSNINYVLTGESRIFKSNNGTLGQVIPNNDSGAWEISGRYDYLNLNDKNVVGGAAHHIGVATTWYANYNFSVTGEYIRSKIDRSFTLEKLKINTLGARLQLVF